jgi:hypothetical protein
VNRLYRAWTQSLTATQGVNCQNFPASTLWQQTYSYDQYGNMGCESGSTGLCTQVGFSTTNNRLSSIGSYTPIYDAAGNLTYDGTSNYQYDAENRLSSVNGQSNSACGASATLCNTYDAFGRVVARSEPFLRTLTAVSKSTYSNSVVTRGL